MAKKQNAYDLKAARDLYLEYLIIYLCLLF